MTTVGMNYQVREGKQEAFERKFALVVETMQGLAGHHRTELYRSVTTGGAYLVVSEWLSRDDFDTFIGSDAFRAVTTWGSENILEGRPSHEVYGDAAPVTSAARRPVG